MNKKAINGLHKLNPTRQKSNNEILYLEYGFLITFKNHSF